MRRLAPVLAALAVSLALAEPPIPPPQGFVTDTAAVLSGATRTRLSRLLEELQQKTGAEIAVLTVDSTAPLDDFSYALQVAEAWKPGKKGEDTGILVLLATRDRRVRVLVGYGLEGLLPDGLVGEIQDREMVPSFRAGNLDEGVARGVTALAAHVAAAKGVTLTGVPTPSGPRAPVALPWWVVLLLLVAMVLLLVAMSRASGPGRFRRDRDVYYLPGGGYAGGLPGGWSGGGGGFGGFGGGSFGGGGAGRSW